MIAVVGALVIGGTIAFYNDTETSTDNIFTAGSIDLKVDHTLATYNGQPCVGNCTETGANLIVNGGFETPVVTDNGGQWQIYPNDGDVLGWDVDSGPGIELQRNSVAGAPHGPVQLVELDSTGSSAMSQTLVTVPGGKYRLHFFHSPRPGVPAGDNTIGFNVKVVSNNSVILTDTVGAASAGGGNTVWTQYTYDFIAIDASTKVIFTDLGLSSNSLGGYIDDVSMFALNCTETGFPNGGICHVWNEKDLSAGDTFWHFPDIKPGDRGTNVISLHVSSNDAYACLIVGDKDDQENPVQPLAPEIAAGDANGIGNPLGDGELSNFLNVFTWGDTNGNGVYDTGEISLGSGPLSTLTSIMSMDSGNGQFLTATTTKNIGLAWCAGTLTPNIGGAFTCDGNGMGNIAQSDSFSASLTAYAEQVRNNSSFSCGDVDLPQDSDGNNGESLGPAPVNLLSANGFVIVAETAITDAGAPLSTITGNIAIDPVAGSAITGVSCGNVTGAGTIYSSGGYTGGWDSNVTCAVTSPGTALAVRSAMETAYTDAATRTGPNTTELGAGNIGGLTIAPGLHKWSTGVTIPTNVTLSGDANDVWIFQISGNLSINSATSVVLSGGAQAKNVFWQVGGPTGATLGTTSTFEGTILSAKQVIIQTDATLNGRALAQTQVTLDDNTVTLP